MPDEFTAAINGFVEKTEKNLLIAVQYALSDMIEDMQTSTAKGGRMPVDTGFLKKSGVAALNQIPQGETIGRRRNANDPAVGTLPEYNYEGTFLNNTFSKMKVGDTFYFGWTAVYARRQEVYWGFLEKAAQNWQTYINTAVKRVNE